MPIKKMTDACSLSEATLISAPTFKGISGRQGTTQPLTERSYQILAQKLAKLNQYSNQTNPNTDSKPKLDLLLERAKIPKSPRPPICAPKPFASNLTFFAFNGLLSL